MAPTKKRAAVANASGGADGAPAEEEKNYITPLGYKKLTEELDFLRWKKRAEVVSALTVAAAEGDRSENAEYVYRKRQLRQIDSRIHFLVKRIDRAVIVDAREQKRRDRIFFGATVTVEDDDGAVHTWRIVGSDETDTASGCISWRSPVGRALLGKADGDAVTIRLESGDRELTVIEIEYPT
jgi:transcription elongation factor GreB